MFCKNCGSQMNADATFCFNCGWSNTLIEEKNKQRNVNIQNKAFLILGIAVSIIAFILLAILNFRKDGWQGDYYYKNGKKLINSWVGDYYVGEDGKYVKNAWAKYENDWYYCGNDGKIIKNAWVDNKNYYVDVSGKMLKNTTTPDGYYVGEDGKYINETVNNKKEVKVSKFIYDKYNYFINEPYPFQELKIDSNGNLWVYYMEGFYEGHVVSITMYYPNGSQVEYQYHEHHSEDWYGDYYYKDGAECSAEEYYAISKQFNNIVDCYDKFFKNN